MSSTLFTTTYSMREDKFQKMVRREKSLRARPIKWLRDWLRKKLGTTHYDHKSWKKDQLIWVVLETEYGNNSVVIFVGVKNQRAK